MVWSRIPPSTPKYPFPSSEGIPKAKSISDGFVFEEFMKYKIFLTSKFLKRKPVFVDCFEDPLVSIIARWGLDFFLSIGDFFFHHRNYLFVLFGDSCIISWFWQQQSSIKCWNAGTAFRAEQGSCEPISQLRAHAWERDGSQGPWPLAHSSKRIRERERSAHKTVTVTW